MPIYLRYNTASQEIPLGYFVDSTDGDTEETGLTIANTDIKLWKTGATTLASKNSGGATHISNGVYYATLDATDTNTIGSMVIFVHVSGALTVRLECVVLSTQVYDSIIAGTDALQVDTIQVGGTTQTANDIGADVNDILTDTADMQPKLGTPEVTISDDIADLGVRIDSIAVTGSAVNTVAESYTLTTGTQTSGTYASTHLQDAVPHTHTDSAGTIDLYYQFDVGVQGVPSSLGLIAYSNGANDDLAVQAYYWDTTTFETVGTLVGKSGSTYDSNSFTLLTRHVGSGANAGKVRIRFYSNTLTSATLYIDQLFVSYSLSQFYQYTVGTVSDATPAAGGFDTDLTHATDFWNDALMIFTSGTLAGSCKPITSYNNTNGAVTFDEPFTSAPANGDAFVIKADHIHPISQITQDIDSNSTQLAAIVADTDELQTNQGNWLTATVVDLNADQSGVTIGTVNAIAGTKSTLDDLTDIDAAGVRTAIGMASADLDTQLDAIVADTGELQTNQGNWLTATVVDLNADQSTVTIGTVNAIAGTKNTLDDLSDLDAAGVRTAVGLASANLDTQIGTLATTTNLESRTPTAAQLAYITANAATGLPVTFSGTGTTTSGTLALVDGGTPSATTDQYKGRLLVFNAGTLNQCVTDITAYDGSTKVVTVTAVPVAITSAHTARLI